MRLFVTLSLLLAATAFAGRPELFLSTGVSVLGATAGLRAPLSGIAEANLRAAWLPRVQSLDVGMNVFSDPSNEGRTRLYLGPELLYYRGQGTQGRIQRLYAQVLMGGEHRICGRIRFALELGPGILLRNGFAGTAPLALPFSLMARSQLLLPIL